MAEPKVADKKAKTPTLAGTDFVQPLRNPKDLFGKADAPSGQRLAEGPARACMDRCGSSQTCGQRSSYPYYFACCGAK